MGKLHLRLIHLKIMINSNYGVVLRPRSAEILAQTTNEIFNIKRRICKIERRKHLIKKLLKG